jgi:hypothetical protein
MESGASSTITALLSTRNPDFPPHNYLKNVIVRHYLSLKDAMSKHRADNEQEGISDP